MNNQPQVEDARGFSFMFFPQEFCLPASRLLNTTPLLEEKWDLGSPALIPNVCDLSHMD